MSRKFAVVGATGQIGRALVASLLEKGRRVRAIGRNREKLTALKALGAEIVESGVDDANRLARAFEGMDGVFVMIPPDYGVADHGAYQDQVGEVLVRAIVRSKVARVLNLSSIGAQHPDHTGPIKGLHRQEKRLNALAGVDVLHLRPGAFMQNFFWSIPTIRQHGMIASSLKADLAMPMVSTVDIARTAAELLANHVFNGKQVFELGGARLLSQAEATRILGAAIGRPALKYVQLGYGDEEKALLAAGLKPSIIQLFVEMHQAFNDGLISPTQPLEGEHRGSITFEQFAQEFAAVFARP